MTDGRFPRLLSMYTPRGLRVEGGRAWPAVWPQSPAAVVGGAGAGADIQRPLPSCLLLARFLSALSGAVHSR